MQAYPPSLKKIQDQFEKTVEPFIEVKSEPVEEDMGVLVSKLGGRPYFTSVDDYPKGSDGKPMIPLAQINFTEVPGLNDFPATGLLQFFVADDDSWGMNLEDLSDQSGFRVVYIPEEEIDEEKAVSKGDFQIAFPSDFFVYKVHKVVFSESEAAITMTDFRNEIDHEYFYELSDEDQDFYWNTVAKTDTHKMGGYPHFGQDDPRSSKPLQKYSTQLLQILSDAKPNETDEEFMNSIHIGKHGRGTIHFFIDPEDLRALNFDDVLYVWDHY